MIDVWIILAALFVVALLAPLGAVAAFLGGGVLIALGLALLIGGIRLTVLAAPRPIQTEGRQRRKVECA